VAQGLLEHCTIILSRYQTYSTSSLEGCGTDTAYAARPELKQQKHHANARSHVAKGRALKQRKRLRFALMPPAPTDFGPHFDFPPASLNNGPTQAPYPGW